MYSYEDRLKAVELCIKYDFSAADTVRELGYPDRSMLGQWYKEYQENGGLHLKFIKQPKYTSDQMKAAVNYYLGHGRNITRTVKAIGYPARKVLREWIDKLAPGERKTSIRRSSMVQFLQEQKKDAVVALCTRESSAIAVADKFCVSRYSLYKWKNELLGKENVKSMDKSDKPDLSDDRDVLLSEVESLKKEIFQKQMELDILNKAAEIIKKVRASIHGN